MPETFHSYLQPFLDYLKFEKRYSQHTVISYENDLSVFLKFIDGYGLGGLAEIKPPFIRTWLAGLKEENISSRTIGRKISTLKSFFKYQLKQGSVTVSPMATIISPKAGKKLPQYVEEKETGFLFNNVQFPDNLDGRRDKLMLMLFYHTGIRKAELIGLTDEHVDGATNTIKVLGKGNKERIIPVSPALMFLLAQYKAAKKEEGIPAGEGVFFVTARGKRLDPKFVYNTVNKYLAQVTTIEKKSPHVLRHSFATQLMNNGADLNAVKELLGHSSLAATQVYTHNSIGKLKVVHRNAHPKA